MKCESGMRSWCEWRWDREMSRRRKHVSKAVELQGSLVGERTISFGPEQGNHKLFVGRDGEVAQTVDAMSDPVEAPVSDPVSQKAIIDTDHVCLMCGEVAALPLGNEEERGVVRLVGWRCADRCYLPYLKRTAHRLPRSQPRAQETTDGRPNRRHPRYRKPTVGFGR